ncbi:FAD binding domain-containing protein [Litorisediminicola beolgyonensis]|uniref:FAD binding domain-containing protein n=1 Tax=Litorisediminicola beolgyonensis TaxID=1173614 RepID=A0ABW3ZH83_9RHOB
MSYLCPTDLASALDLVAEPGALIVAGGTDLYPASGASGLAGRLIDLTRIEDLTGISRQDGALRIGAATTWSALVHADLPPAFDALRQAAREVGSLQIQNAGTIAGNLCNASPAADGVPPLLILNAEVELASAARGVRRVPVSRFITGVRATARDADEIVTAVIVPPLPDGAGSAFEKLGSRRYMVISIAMTAALVVLRRDRTITDLRVATGACSAVAQRLSTLEAALEGSDIDALEIGAELIPELAPIDDVRGTALYRLEVVLEQIRRAIRRAAAND